MQSIRQSRSISIQHSRRHGQQSPKPHPSPSRLNPLTSIQNSHYYCHFKNAIYMGGIKAFQKHGRGVMVHDDGTCAITSYFNDFRDGHNVYYRENCIMSVLYQKNKVKEAVVRVGAFLLMVRYGKEGKPEGKALLIDYAQRAIYYVLYRRGAIVEKVDEKDQAIVNRIFDLQNLEYLVGEEHAGVLRFQIEKDQNIASQKNLSKFQAGFYKKGFMNGLGFILTIKNPHPTQHPHSHLYIQTVQRGYFLNSQLHGMGQKRFKNGNLYIGDFKAGAFEGRGLLKNQVKKNWVYGIFEAGNLCDMLSYSHEGEKNGSEGNGFGGMVMGLHERKNNWINKQITMPDHQQYLIEIEKICTSNPTEQMRNLREKKQEVLKKIQDAFIYDNNNENSGTGMGMEWQGNSYNQQNQSRNSNINMNMNNSRSKQINNSRSMQHSRSMGGLNLKITPPQPQKQKYSTNSKQSQQEAPTSSYRNKNQPQEPGNTTKESSARVRATSSRQLGVIPEERTRSPVFRSRFPGASPTQEQLSFALDSKRLIGRSRIFKQFSSSEEPQLPKFNYHHI